MKKIVVLISGHGMNLQALIDACKSSYINAEIVGVFSNKSDAFGLQRAKSAGIFTALFCVATTPTTSTWIAILVMK
ncbi:Phosphoribosylglycinamide formyltransferase [Aggregatibacter aphrophilus]|uniref:phosphoribosylglycinamide formyltransferase 1 n=1 Tax=Aggregatibacter aphrophilus TaxID=732 RepID=A0A336N579_AGGAP|nr:Phosphoribosylglycinamide formyltransferase [Aggregatibacter aphrophilus]